MEALNKIIVYLEARERKQFYTLLLYFLGAVLCVSIGIIWVIFDKKSELIKRLKTLNNLTEKSFRIIEDNRRMTKEELRLKEVLDKDKDFTIKGFFELFCREQNLSPDPWDARSEPVNDRFDEILLPATFKDITSDKLVKTLEALNKKEIVYLKEIVIKNTGRGKITVTMTIATKRYKSSLE